MTRAEFRRHTNETIRDLLPRYLLAGDDAEQALIWCEHWSLDHSDADRDQPGLAARDAIGAWLDVQMLEVE